MLETRSIEMRGNLMNNTHLTVRTQVAITKHLKHRNLVTLYEVIDDPSHHTLYLIVEYCERGPYHFIERH